MEEPTLIMDTREYNKEFMKYMNEANKKRTENNQPPKWIREELKLSKYIIVDGKVDDYPCGDITNSNIDGIIELKSYSDFVGSTTGGGVTRKAVVQEVVCPDCGKKQTYRITERRVLIDCPHCKRHESMRKIDAKHVWAWSVNEGRHHLQNQVVKMHGTGIPYAVIVYGSRYLFQKKSGVSDELIIQANRKLISLQAKFKFTVSFVGNGLEALKMAETFLRKAPEMAHRYVNYNIFKGVEDEAVNALCGFTGIGPEIAWRIIEMYSLAEIGHDVNTMDRKDFINKYAKNKETKVPDVGNVTAGKLYDNFTFTGPQPEPQQGVDY